MKTVLSNLASFIIFGAVCFSFCFAPELKRLALTLAEAPTAALLVTLSLFFFNCAAGIIPLSALYLVCGCVLPPLKAFFMCALGSAMCFSAFYREGKSRGKRALLFVTAPPKAGKHTLFAAFFLHCVRLFPSRAAGLCLGAAGLPFRAYLAGSLLGALPAILFSLSAARFPAGLEDTPQIWYAAAALSAFIAAFYLTKRR